MNVQRNYDEALNTMWGLIKLLPIYSSLYDSISQYSILAIGSTLRTILKDSNNTQSLLSQTNRKNKMQFLDTAIKGNSNLSFWNINNVSNCTIIVGNIYAGLLAKSLTTNNNEYILDFTPLKEKNNKYAEWKSFDEWYEKTIIFKNNSYKMTRKDVVEIITDKDGGSHFDPTIPDKYDIFRHPTSLNITLNGTLAVFNQNPVYVSLLQIAYEVVESIRNYDAN
jgi:hypothetical protein